MAIENSNSQSSLVYPWLQKAWEQFELDSLPQAILLHGQKGLGKFDFGLTLAQAILCEADLFTTGEKPCRQCQACRWFETGNHPDFITLLAPAYRGRLTLAEPEGATAAPSPEPEEKEEGEGKKESAYIKIAEVREAMSGIHVASHRGGRRVVLIYPLESLRDDAANTLLKSLEEPDPETIFILISDRLDQVLPTIRSRCQLIALPKPTRDHALEWLKLSLADLKDLKISAEEIEATLDEQAGSPLSAKELILARHEGDDKDGLGLIASASRTMLEALSKGRAIPWLECAEKVQKAPYGALLTCLQRWLFDLQTAHQLGELRYYRRHAKQIQSLAGQLHLARAQRLWSTVVAARKHENHPLSTRVQMESMLLQYQQIFGD